MDAPLPCGEASDPTFTPTLLFCDPSQIFPAESLARYCGKLSVSIAEYEATSVIALFPHANRRLYPGLPRTAVGEYGRIFRALLKCDGSKASGTELRPTPPNSNRQPSFGFCAKIYYVPNRNRLRAGALCFSARKVNSPEQVDGERTFHGCPKSRTSCERRFAADSQCFSSSSMPIARRYNTFCHR